MKWRLYPNGSARERMKSITSGMDFILGKGEKEQKEFKKLSVELAKTHALCAATEGFRVVLF